MSSDLPATVTIPETVTWQQVGDEVVLQHKDPVVARNSWEADGEG